MKRFTVFAIVALLFVFNDPASADTGLPIKIIPANGTADQPLVFVISGDGGLNDFIQSVSGCFSRRGMPVIVLDSKKYFWDGRTPGETASAVNSMIGRYLREWKRSSYILVGYSFGGCIVPFIANRTPASLKQQMSGLCAISPDERGDFEIHLSDMLSLNPGKGKYDVLSEMKKTGVLNPVCIFGNAEKPGLRQNFSKAGIRVVTLAGDHHYNNSYCAVAEAVVQNTQVK